MQGYDKIIIHPVRRSMGLNEEAWVYLRHCVLAVQKQGNEVLDDFLDHTFLYDRKTTIRNHLESNDGIMKEKPPESLMSRYNG
mmetsp:Transcript_16380/g.40382  ORF Transcript_16380/g.40382 Transcript_16380/m.40382 type:complete len:83 (+) Transcript_16380:706-954(+)